MKRFSLPIVLDVLFYSFSVWLLALCILRYYRLPLGIAVAVSLLFALAVAEIAALLLYGRSRKKFLGRKEREAREALLLHLALEKSERVRATLLEAFLKDGREANCAGEQLAVDGVRLVPLFTMEPLSADAVASVLRESGSEPFTLACNELTPDADKLLSSFGRDVLRGDDIFALFSRTETTPSPLICGEIPRKTARQKWKRTFSKTNARPFFVSGVLLLLMSLFALFPVYYIITGAILLCCAVTVRLFGCA